MVSGDEALPETPEIPTREKVEQDLTEAVQDAAEHIDPSVVDIDAITARALNDAGSIQKFFELSQKEQRRFLAKMSAERAALAETNIRLNAAVGGLKGEVEKLKEDVHTLLLDDVTGLLVRKYFVKHSFPSTVGMLRRINTKPRALSFVLIDLDDFKTANTRFGLSGGDVVLKETARVLKDKAFKRENVDKLVRFGGDEFAAAIPFSANEDVAKICDKRLLQEMRKLRFGPTSDYQQTLSIAVVTIELTREVTAPPIELLKGMSKLGGDALLECKNTGKNQVRNLGVVSIGKVLDAAAKVENFNVDLEPPEEDTA